MQTEQFDELLLEIKCFLAKYSQLEGAFNLLARLDAFLVTKLKKQPISNQECMEIILDSEDDQSTMIQPRKFASILDLFILDYNFETQAYEIIPSSLTAKSQQIEGNRTALCELILCPTKDHVCQKQKTSSMTQLHKLTSNIPRSLPCLVLPNYSEQPFKYIYIYESKQCQEHNDKYYLVDRYYCFVLDGLATQDVDALYKDIKNRVFQERITRANDPVDVAYKFVRDCLDSVLPLLVDKVNQFPIQLGLPASHPWVEHEKQYYFSQLKSSILSSLVVLTTYFAICEYKVIFLTSKEEKHKLSDAVLSVEGALSPLKYVYPVVFCTLNRNHCDFVQSPVPLTIGYWGSDRRKSKFEQQLKQYLNTQVNAIPTILIDLQKNCIRYSSGINRADELTLQKLHRFVKKYGKGGSMHEKISSFLSGVIKDIQSKKKEKSEWLTILHDKIRNSQMYHQHTNK